MKKNKILDPLYYVFNPASKTITFDGSLGLKQQDILLIVNLNGNKMIYNFACSDDGGVMNGSVLTFTYNVTTMSASDRLMVFVSEIDRTEEYLKKIADNTTDMLEIMLEKQKENINS